jgi:FKBP-type peptidyl-prolyl cis-trans isomerase FkpA
MNNNKQIITFIVITVAALAVGYFIGSEMGGVKSENQVSLENKTDSLNYFLGLNVGYSLMNSPWDWERDGDLVISGINQVMNDTSMFDALTSQTLFQKLTMEAQQTANKEAIQRATDNLEKGIAFLEENGKREGVITTESGLQYEVITEGTGPKPEATSRVTVAYEGSLIDGTVFDTSDSISFPLDGVIRGWTEGVQLMPQGSTYKLYIPSNLGYGPRDSGPIPGNSVLIFKIELKGIE